MATAPEMCMNSPLSDGSRALSCGSWNGRVIQQPQPSQPSSKPASSTNSRSTHSTGPKEFATLENKEISMSGGSFNMLDSNGNDVEITAFELANPSFDMEEVELLFTT